MSAVVRSPESKNLILTLSYEPYIEGSKDETERVSPLPAVQEVFAQLVAGSPCSWPLPTAVPGLMASKSSTLPRPVAEALYRTSTAAPRPIARARADR